MDGEDNGDAFQRLVRLVENEDLLGVVHAHTSGQLPDLNAVGASGATIVDWLCDNPHPHHLDMLRLLVSLGARVQEHHVTRAVDRGASYSFVRALRRARTPLAASSRFATSSFALGAAAVLLSFLWATRVPFWWFLSFPVPPLVVLRTASKRRASALVDALDGSSHQDGLFLALHLACVVVIGVAMLDLRGAVAAREAEQLVGADRPSAPPAVFPFFMNLCLVCAFVLQPALVLAVRARRAALSQCGLPADAKLWKLASLADRLQFGGGDAEAGGEDRGLLAAGGGRSRGSETAPQVCPTCLIAMPAGSRHCGACGVCVGGFDHHCPFVATCVGEHNRRLFVLTMLNSAVLSASFLACALPLMWADWCEQCPPTVRFGTYAALVGLQFSTPMFLLQLVAAGSTTFECLNSIDSSLGRNMGNLLGNSRGVPRSSDGGGPRRRARGWAAVRNLWLFAVGRPHVP